MASILCSIQELSASMFLYLGSARRAAIEGLYVRAVMGGLVALWCGLRMRMS